jgi:hypothetical protein
VAPRFLLCSAVVRLFSNIISLAVASRESNDVLELIILCRMLFLLLTENVRFRHISAIVSQNQPWRVPGQVCGGFQAYNAKSTA